MAVRYCAPMPTKVELALMDPAERVRFRLQEWMDTTGITQRPFASKLKKTQPWLQAILKGQNAVRLQDLDDIAAALSTTASELVRKGDDRYVVELTPDEFRVLQRWRHSPEIATAVQTLLEAHFPKKKVTVDFGTPRNRRR